MLAAGRARALIALLTVVLVALDQWTKVLAVAHLDPMQPPRYLGGLVTLQLIRNPGAAFSLGGGDFTLVFTILAAVAIQVVLVMLVPKVRDLGWTIVTGLLLAGIVGNFIDRLFREPGFLRGHVVDFVKLPYFNAIFNVADVCLTTAAGLIILFSLVRNRDLDGSARASSPARRDETPGQAAIDDVAEPASASSPRSPA